VEKQTLACVFRPAGGGPIDNHAWTIEQFGVELGAVAAGHLVWSVVAASKGLPAGALAGTYGGVGANASIGVGAGTNRIQAFMLRCDLRFEGKSWKSSSGEPGGPSRSSRSPWRGKRA
jgi:hypothetical protein